ncbi:MAG: UvrD-helicase domain-containing protein, partial [Desulfobaccales bacterium]
MNETNDFKDKFQKAKNERQRHVDKVLNSTSMRKIVVGGPGTGKTHLFKKILERKNNSLTLTFVNSLVEDLSLELCGLSDVRTLHSFAYSVLNKHSGGVKIFPKLSEIIKEDAQLLLNNEVDFDKLFYNRQDNNEYIDFYKKRRKYYKHYGYTDIIFGAVLYLEKFKDKIPHYDQIVVDEFQDFNTLEVSLIDLLSENNSVLLAGDDDQALYDFKSASTKHIRERHSNEKPEYASFKLPYCSRCTRVIVETANDIIQNAEKNGYLKGRINKEYLYFEDKQKNEVSYN